MKQKTLEEAAERYYSEQSNGYEDAIEPIFDNSRYLVAGFIEGAKWQQEQDKNKYSEEDMRKAFIAGGNSQIEEDDDYGSAYDAYMEEWFEKFKNK